MRVDVITKRVKSPPQRVVRADERRPVGALEVPVLSRQEALLRGFRLVRDLQDDVPEASAQLSSLLVEARRRGWGDVVRVGLFAQAVGRWFVRDGAGAAATVDELIDESTEHGDEVMLALGLAMRAGSELFVGGTPAGP